MWYTIKKGVHRAFPLSLGIHTGKTSESYEVIFDDSCRYVPNEENDWNKLCGWSYGILPKVDITWAGFSTDLNIDWDVKFIPAHHRNSIRIGWRYNQELDKIELCLYMYEEGFRKYFTLKQLYDFNEVIHLELNYELREVSLYSSNCKEKSCTNSLLFDSKPKWGYNLGLYFGGQAVTQHDTKVFIKKL